MDTAKMFTAQGAALLVQSDGCAVWQFRNETCDGTMTAYEVFPGVMLTFNDFHMERYESSYVADRRLLAIDHCREGRMEYLAGDDRVAYTEAGDMKLNLRRRHTGTFSFPSCHYHGLTVAFDLELAGQSLPLAVRDFPVTPEKICIPYFRIKILELLLREGGSSAEIGSRVGYDSPGKFTAAFKKVMKLTPSEYRKERGAHHER